MTDTLNDFCFFGFFFNKVLLTRQRIISWTKNSFFFFHCLSFFFFFLHLLFRFFLLFLVFFLFFFFIFFFFFLSKFEKLSWDIRLLPVDFFFSLTIFSITFNFLFFYQVNDSPYMDTQPLSHSPLTFHIYTFSFSRNSDKVSRNGTRNMNSLVIPSQYKGASGPIVLPACLWHCGKLVRPPVTLLHSLLD